MHCSRRDLLKWAAGATACCATGINASNLFGQAAGPSAESKKGAAQVQGGAAKKKIPIGLQIWSVRDIAKKDHDAALALIAEMGYEGVECAGFLECKDGQYLYLGQTAEQLRKAFDKNHLKCCGMHTSLMMLSDEHLKGLVEFNQALDNPYLVVASLPAANMASVAALLDTAKFLTAAAAKVKDRGMRVGFHAHDRDFKPVADRIPWEVIFSNTGPEVMMQMDVGNCMMGGGDPVALLKQYPHRTPTIHLKEFGGPEGAVIGEGTAPWPQIFELCETIADTVWYIVEQEKYRGSSVERSRQCLENLRKMGK